MGHYLVDLDSVHEHFPPEFPPPKLLLEFADWLDNCKGSIGLPKLWVPERIIDWGGATDMHRFLIPFIRTPCGSIVSFWFPDGKPILHPPVVLVSSEGEHDLMGSSMEDFLLRLATRKTGDSDLDWREDELPDAGPGLKAWLRKHSKTPPGPTKPLPNFAKWFQEKRERGWARDQSDPNLQKLAEELRKIAPPKKKDEWYKERFEATVAGRFFAVQHDAKLLPEKKAKSLEPLIRAERERRAKACPEHGASFVLGIYVHRTVAATVQCEFLQEPEFLGAPRKISVKDYRADLKAFPRTSYWTPAWLKKKLG